MAEACRLGSQQKIVKSNTVDQEENFCMFNVLCVFISLVTILADLTTDILVFAEYCKNGYVYWAIATLIFILTPNILINIFSMRWFVADQKSDLKHWITHGCLVGFVERYILFLYKVLACQNLETQKLVTQRHDLNLLHFLYIFTGTIPQIILQSYSVLVLDENYHTKVFALAASNASVIWGCGTYIYSMLVLSNDSFKWTSLILNFFWHFGMLVARMSGILLFTVIFGIWTLLPIGLHWIAMTFWIIIQNTTFCPNKLEETLYNVVMGFVYCFCYINLREGHTRYRLMMFYTLMVTQNFGSLFLYVLITDSERQKSSWSIAASVCIMVGTLLGLSAMILYYRYFHSKGPIPWKPTHEDIELNNKVATENSHINKKNGLHHVRSFKNIEEIQVAKDQRNKKHDVVTRPQTENENADKKFLLDHWIARSGSPTFTSAPVGNISMGASSIEIYTVENTPQSTACVKMNRKVTICSPTELTLKLSSIDNLESSIDEITSNNINIMQKRRGICSSDELREDLTNFNFDENLITEGYSKNLKTDHGSIVSHDTDGSNKKTSSDSIDMDLDLSFSDINSSDINTFNENIVQKLCLSALKNIKVGNQDADIENIQRIALDILKEMYTKKDRIQNGISNRTLSSKQRDLDTPTELLSVHDYENICAVNIAREAWGLRSWNGYCDIENWLHDGSVVRDRRRDTLTSASTEVSSCISQDLKNAILAAPTFPKKTHTYSNVFVKFDRSNQDDYMNTASYIATDETFLAKPCMVDNSKDPNHLEPIIEELDDLGDIDPSNKKRLNSESSLVATIDEIRKVTVTNSPRNVFHRRELWDSPQFNAPANIDCHLKRALWKEPSKFHSSNIMESLPEKENILGIQSSKFDFKKKELNFSAASATYNSLELDNPENVSTYNKNPLRRPKSVCHLKTQHKRNKPEQHLQDLSNKDIDFLWQLVSENSLALSSTEDLSSNRRTASLQSLIHRDVSVSPVNTSVTKVSNAKKAVKGKPRRKFSILRERFEHKINLNSDEEILYHYSAENARNQFEANDNMEMTPQQGQVNLPINDTNTYNQDTRVSISNMGKNVKEKRSMFMKQVLSPPKFNTKLHKVTIRHRV